MSIRPTRLFSLIILLAPLLVQAEITLAPIFADHAVLQRDKPLPVWGRGVPKEKLTVTFQNQTVRTTVDSDGRWIVYFEPLETSAEGTDLVVVAGKETRVIKDLVVGEVWLAVGQSNMEWPISHVRDEEREAAMVDLPLLRHLKIAQTVAGSPAETVTTSGWQKAAPETVGSFTAVGYFFARELQRKLDVPLGIINCSWGGTPIEAWMSEVALRSTSLAATVEERWRQALADWPPERVAANPAEVAAFLEAEAHAKATKTRNPLPWPPLPATPDSRLRPSGLFNAMIAPLQPAALRGVVWYQGERNVEQASDYGELFKAMIGSWRANWGDETWPFLFVQLPNYAHGNPGGREWARLREAQAKALELPGTSMAVTIDLGDPNDIHPTNKMEVGRRLALAAQWRVYGIPGDYSGPIFASATPEGATMRVRFHHASPGLVAHHRPVQSLEIAGPDKVFHVGTGRFDRDTLLISSPAVKQPVAVRYAWSNAPAANLYDGAGLPAAPFRSDDW